MLQRTYTKEYYIRFMPSLVKYYRSPKMAASWLLLGDIWATQAKRKAEEERSREEKQREEERKEEDNNSPVRAWELVPPSKRERSLPTVAAVLGYVKGDSLCNSMIITRTSTVPF